MSSSNGNYSEQRASAATPDFSAAGGFFSSDARKHDDLKNMLDSSKDGLKLEAMKRIIGMIARGRDASGLFPSVVKNVVCQNIEVKKLVYVYLVRYAEEQQDLALLSISTFQRALKGPNQLIRASALRVLSSIRVSVIVPIMFLAIKDAVSDMSPYVRKTAAHAIPKLYTLDPDQKDALVEVIERLLADKTTLVVGSAVMAFEEVCPERIDLIHRNYRKLCNLLVDVEEWGQVVIILMLTRYARTQFTDPNLNVPHEESFGTRGLDEIGRTEVKVDPDLRLLLRNCKPLLQSRNSAVVMAVCQLYFHLAPSSELNVTTKAMIRLLRAHREIQTVVLSNIATMSTMSSSRKSMFEPYLKSFFVRTSDPTHIKVLKLEILSNIATESNISTILREFQTYLQSTDMEFVQATIHCIGRVAHQIKEVADTCLGGLTALLSSRNELVVAESVVVIKKLLQIESGQHSVIIKQMAKLLDKIQVPMARASILWLIAEYSEANIAPDVLRRVAKTFCQEEDLVKLQALNLASRLSLTDDHPRTKLIVQYIFNLAKYDQNYDIRDRVRFLRQLCHGTDQTGNLAKHAKKILLSSKPAPKLQSPFGGREQYQMGSLSHLINQPAAGYRELPDFPDVAPESKVRDVTPPPTPVVKRNKPEKTKPGDFYGDVDNEVSEAESETEESEESCDSGDVTGSESESECSSSSDDPDIVRKAAVFKQPDLNGGDVESEDSTSESERNSGSSESEEEPDSPKVQPKKPPSVDLLLDLDDFGDVPAPAVPISYTAIPAAVPATKPKESSPQITPVTTAVYPVLERQVLSTSWSGIQLSFRYTRCENIYSSQLTSLEFTVDNRTDRVLDKIVIEAGDGIAFQVKGTESQVPLNPGLSFVATVGVDFGDSAQEIRLKISIDEMTPEEVRVTPPIGEIIRPIIVSVEDFESLRKTLKGMCENSGEVPSSMEDDVVREKVQRTFNVIVVQGADTGECLRFAAQTMSSKCLVLITVERQDGILRITTNCEKMVIGKNLLSQLKKVLADG